MLEIGKDNLEYILNLITEYGYESFAYIVYDGNEPSYLVVEEMRLTPEGGPLRIRCNIGDKIILNSYGLHVISNSIAYLMK